MSAWIEHGDEVAAQQGFDAGRVVQEHRRDELGALELGVAFLQVGLVLVGGQQLGAGHGGVVADQREAAVGGGVARDLGLVDGEADAVVGAGDAAVAGVVAGSATFLLPEPLVGVCLDGAVDPAGGADLVERRGGGLLGGDGGFHPGLG